MTAGKIIYIDEDSDDIMLFQQFINDKFEVETLKIENGDSLNCIVDEILSTPPDAIITDYLLNEKALVDFNGQTLIELIQKRNSNIPCFLLTSHAPDALNATHDARLVYSKSITSGGNDMQEHQNNFLTQIEKLIYSAKKKYFDATHELEKLLAINKDKITSKQRQRIIELDNFFESHGLSSNIVPNEIKDDRNIEMLTNLIDKIDILISKVK